MPRGSARDGEDDEVAAIQKEKSRMSFDTEPSFDPEVSGPKGRTKCKIAERNLKFDVCGKQQGTFWFLN